MKKLIYLASPYSSSCEATRERRFEAACIATGALMRKGYVVFSPIALAHPIAVRCGLPKGWEYWKQFDETFLSACSYPVVLQLPGWDVSEGVKAETLVADDLGLPTYYVLPEDIETFTLPGYDQRDYSDNDE